LSSAFGKTVVPISRPSITIPFFRPISCCWCTANSLTSLIAATSLTFSAINKWSFDEGNDSPVRINSLAENPLDSINRISAGIPTPSESSTMSPGTSSSENISMAFPSLVTVHLTTTSFFTVWLPTQCSAATRALLTT